jgi:crotonobetainyl-CoA:carnitine CoA-transferase CaiB-like acyl-CoA transferase
MDINGEANGNAVKLPVALIDVLAAHHLKEGLLLALLKREKTGGGSFVEVSLLQAAVASLANQASNWLVGGVVPKRKGSLHPNIAPYGEVFELSDGRQMIVAIGTDRQFVDFCQLVGAAELALQEAFTSNILRVKHRTQLFELLAPKVATYSSSHLMPLIHERKIPAGLIQNIAEVFEMPEVQNLVLQHGNLQGLRTFVAHGVHTSCALTPPPHLGADNNELQSTFLKGERQK